METFLYAIGSLLLVYNCVGCKNIDYYEDIPQTKNADGSSNCDTHLNCGPLRDRLTISELTVDEAIAYLVPGYNYRALYPRVALQIQPNSQALVAWINSDLDRVHITPLTEDLRRRSKDYTVPAKDLTALVAHNDGFAILVRRPDPGQNLATNTEGQPAMAVFLIRYQNGGEKFAVPLTGTTGLDASLDYNSADQFRGRLGWNGKKYGAYFEIRAGRGHEHNGIYSDKLIYIDDSGKKVDGGWDWQCSTNRGFSLIPEENAFTAFCLSDGAPQKGLNLVIENREPTLLEREEAWSGYSGGSFGGVIKMEAFGYVVAWASRGWDPQRDRAEKEAHDIMLLRLDSDFRISSKAELITDTPLVDEVNLHIAPYGKDRILLAWDEIENFSYTDGTCFGKYGGTYIGIYKFNGDHWDRLDGEKIDASLTWDQDMGVYPNGDLIWAFVEDTPDYTRSYRQVGDLPEKRTIKIAHLRYCDPK